MVQVEGRIHTLAVAAPGDKSCETSPCFPCSQTLFFGKFANIAQTCQDKQDLLM